MKIHDLTLTISPEMVVYKNKEEKKPQIILTKTLAQGANESKIVIDAHTGTHLDAPRHMIEHGVTIERVSLEKCIGPCVVLDMTFVAEKITEKDILIKKNQIKKNDIVLLKTKNVYGTGFDFNFVYLQKTGAAFLAQQGIKAVGINALGIEREQPEHDTHRLLFEHGISIIEGLQLAKIKEGRYFFVGLPLKIKGADASPIRAVLIEEIEK